MTSRPSTAAPILAVLAIVLVPLGIYVGGYFWLPAVSPAATSSGLVLVKIYPYRWQAGLFSPAASVESFFGGTEVMLGSEEEMAARRLFKPPPTSPTQP